MASGSYPHITIDDRGVPALEGSAMTVVEVVEAYAAADGRAERVVRKYPGLQMGEVFSALAYFFDHKEDFDPTRAGPGDPLSPDKRFLRNAGNSYPH